MYEKKLKKSMTCRKSNPVIIKNERENFSNIKIDILILYIYIDFT